ncbi:MAG: hypothetical protein F4Y88_04265 [Chloroflexi bacterium]|nr:hypothetical protein [Chloroflexota bacterium]
MKSKMLGALALFTLIGALFVMQSAEQHTPTVEAATGSIAALNVGTCLTTDNSVFKGDCDALMNHADGTDNDWEVRDKIAEVSTLYATYAHDPKTSSDAPRAILMDSDLLKISIADADRDKRSGVLIAGNTLTTKNLSDAGNAGLKAAIEEDLGEDLHYPKNTAGDIQFSHADNAGLTAVVVGNAATGGAISGSIVGNSGNSTLNFGRDATRQFHPGDFKVDDGAVVRFYGCLDDDEDGTCEPDGEDGTPNNADDEPYINLKNSISVDEDASNGNAGGDTAPWLGINSSVPAGVDIVILAIYYRTSDEENLIGGQVYHSCGTNLTLVDRGGTDGWKCAPDSGNDQNTDKEDGTDDVVYTSNEKSRNQALLVKASADGDLEDRGVNLHLTETGRFDGVYQGFVRLTDANGDGRDDNSTPAKTDITDWGRQAKDGMGNTDSDEDVAVLAVESGPITIEYRDSNGATQRLRIEIDKTPPTVSVTSPANGSSSGDQTPDFAGTLEDTDSGLADKSFRLVVDNQVENKDGDNEDFALNGKAPDATGVTGPATGLTRIAEYSGYSMADPPSQFGIVSMAGNLYNLGDDRCVDGENDCYIESEAYDDGAISGSFDDSLRLDLYDGTSDFTVRDREFQIDFQAFVMDMAGNIGFSDSDPANPRYINDLGEADATKRKAGNVLGYYSAHIITLDEKDPEIINARSATGYYGLNADGKPIADRSGVMVVFDGPIAASSVSTSTFSVELDDETAGNIVDAHAAKNFVFLKLGAELASDATPEIDIAQGEKVEDMAGNETFGREVTAFDANDGISPRLTVTLSGGSGSGTGNEGPDKLTKDQITVNVSSDEELQGAPRIAVVCSSLTWNEGKNAIEGSSDLIGKDIDDYIANRSGAFDTTPSETPVDTSPRATKNASGTYQYTCGYDANGDDFDDNFVPQDATSLSRPGENWDYTWKGTDLEDGLATAVVFARDRSRFTSLDGNDTVQNWGSASAEFTLDTAVVYPDPSGDVSKGGDLQPAPDSKSKEARPFVLIEFNEGTTVTLDSVELDGVEVASEFEQPDHNRFVYWPESLSQGDHEVEVEATDAAGNEASFSYEFETVARGDFVMALNAGWNAISVPADPVDTAIGSVFTDSAVTTVIGWDTQGWRIAMRRDGVWESNEKYGALNEIRAKYGYWVKSTGFVRQAVELKGGTSRDAGGTPILISIPTEPGWNFVGVVDQDGDQTEDHFGLTLQDTGYNAIKAGEYLGNNYVRAYTWDATFSRFDVVRPDDTMTIGDGVWVYYPEGTGIAP